MRVLFVGNLYPPTVLGGYERLCGDIEVVRHGETGMPFDVLARWLDSSQ